MNCPNPNCLCSHTSCEAGWVWGEFKTRKTQYRNGQPTEVVEKHEGVWFCHLCYPERATIQRSAKSRNQFIKQLAERAPTARRAAYVAEEKERTKVF